MRVFRIGDSKCALYVAMLLSCSKKILSVSLSVCFRHRSFDDAVTHVASNIWC